MTFVVTENCIKCKFTDCVDVCPVDCFHEGPNFLVIDPDECIDCSLCEPECPAHAIFSEDEVPENQRKFIELNKATTMVCELLPLVKKVSSNIPTVRTSTRIPAANMPGTRSGMRMRRKMTPVPAPHMRAAFSSAAMVSS